jgi:hypothetical protein
MAKILFVASAVKWFDRVNGNTYHSVRVTRCKDGATIACPWQYGYGDQYRWTALAEMCAKRWIPAKYGERNPNGTNSLGSYERENDYPIQWNERAGKKREMIAHGTL